MRETMKRFLSVLLAVTMLLQMMPVSALAEGWASFRSSSYTMDTTWTVTFCDPDGNSYGGTTINVQNRHTVGEANMAALTEPTKEGYAFVGWYTEQTGGFRFTKDTIVTGNMSVYARFAEQMITVTFDSDGGSPVASKTMLANSNTQIYTSTAIDAKTATCGYTEHTHNDACYDANGVMICEQLAHQHHETYCYPEVQYTYDPAPVKEGFVFAGWADVTDDAQSTADTPMTAAGLSTDRTYKAKWVAANVDFRVTYMIEDLDYGWKFLNSETRRAPAGTTPEVNAGNARPIMKGYDPDGFGTPSISAPAIRADGSTVVTVSYPRKTFTLRFFERDEKGNDTQLGVIRARYGDNISDQWQAINAHADGSVWIREEDLNTENPEKIPFMLEMPAYDKDFYLLSEQEGRVDRTLRYYVELTESELKDSAIVAAAKDDPKDAASGKKFKFHSSVVLNVPDGHALVYDNAYHEIAGYERYWTDIGTWNENKEPGIVDANMTEFALYYTLGQYPLTFTDLSKTGENTRTETVTYGSDITDEIEAATAWAETNKPADATVAGWYTDPLMTQSFKTAGATMPAGLNLYAGWHMGDVSFTFDMNDGSNAQRVVAYDIGDQPEYQDAYVRAGYTFLGWYDNADMAAAKLYDFSKPLTGNVTVYAQWELNPIEYTVKYINQNTNEPVHDDRVITVGTEMLNQEITEVALVIDGMRPNVRDQKITLTDNPNQNVITFLYDTAQPVIYTVRCLDASGNVLVFSPEYQAQNPEGAVRQTVAEPEEVYVSVDAPALFGYTLAAGEAQNKGLLLCSDMQQNVIEFKYDQLPTYTITVQHQDASGNALKYYEHNGSAYEEKTKGYDVYTWPQNTPFNLVLPAFGSFELAGVECNPNVLSGDPTNGYVVTPNGADVVVTLKYNMTYDVMVGVSYANGTQYADNAIGNNDPAAHVADGTYTITLTYGGKTETITATFKDGVCTYAPSTTITVPRGVQITATITGTDASGNTVDTAQFVTKPYYRKSANAGNVASPSGTYKEAVGSGNYTTLSSNSVEGLNVTMDTFISFQIGTDPNDKNEATGMLCYNLALAGSYFTDTTGWDYLRMSGAGGVIYVDTSRRYMPPVDGDKQDPQTADTYEYFTVTSRIPKPPKDSGYAFIGWLDKEYPTGSSNTDGAGNRNPSRVYRGGEKGKFTRASQSNTQGVNDAKFQTLDGVWARFDPVSTETTYDGTVQKADASFDGTGDAKDALTYNAQLASTYQGQAKAKIDSARISYTYTDENGTEHKEVSDPPSYKNVGVHEFYVNTHITMGGQTYTGQAKATMTINPAPITITVNGGQYAYDTTPKPETVAGFSKISYSGLQTGDTLDVNSIAVRYGGSANQTLPGDYTTTVVNTQTLKIKDSAGNDVTANYAITWDFVPLTILPDPDVPLQVLITGAETSAKYTGSTISATGFTMGTVPSYITVPQNVLSMLAVSPLTGVDVKRGANNEIDAYEFWPSWAQTTYNGNPAVMLEDTSNGLKVQYIVTSPLKLTIEPRKFKILTGDATKPYDGTPLTLPGYTLTGDEIAPGDDFEINVTGQQTLVGSSDNTVTYSAKPGTKAGNYEITTDPGTLTVTAQKYKIYLTANSLEKDYNGLDIEVTGFSTKDCKVTKVNETIDPATGATTEETVVYNVNYDHTNKTVSFYLNGKRYTVENVYAQAKEKDVLKVDGAVSSYDVPVTTTGYRVLDAQGVDVTRAPNATEPQFEIVPTPGKLKINPVPLTITVNSKTGDAAPTYDGTAKDVKLTDATGEYYLKHTNGTLQNEQKLNLSGVSVQYKAKDSSGVVTGDAVNAINAGKYEASVSDATAITITESDETTAVKLDNYDITIVPGELEIKPRPVTIYVNSADDYTFDGTRKTVDGGNTGKTSKNENAGANTTALTSGLEYVVETANGDTGLLGEHTVGDVNVRYQMEKFFWKNTTNMEKGEQTITADDASLRDPGSGKSIDRGETNHDVGAMLSGVYKTVITDADKNGITITDASGGDVKGNYAITVVPGTLTIDMITENAIWIVGYEYTKTYDGAQHGVNVGVALGNLAKDYENNSIPKTMVRWDSQRTDTELWPKGDESAATVNSASIGIGKGARTVTFTKGSTTYTVKGFSWDDVLEKDVKWDRDGTNKPVTHQHRTAMSWSQGNYSVTANGVDVTKEFIPVYDDGWVRIKPRPVTITAEDATVTYDGTEKNVGATVSNNNGSGLRFSWNDADGDAGLLNGHTIKGSGTADNLTDDAIEVKYYEASGSTTVTTNHNTENPKANLHDNVAANAVASYATGTGSEKTPVNVLRDATTKDVIAYKAVPAPKDSTTAGDTTTGIIFEGATDVSKNYIISYAANDLTIKPRPVLIQGGDRDFDYDGDEKKAWITGTDGLEYTVEIAEKTGRANSGLVPVNGSLPTVNGVDVTYKSTTDQTDTATDSKRLPGEYTAIVDITGVTIGTVTSNYTIQKQDGSLTINTTSYVINVSAPDRVEAYDGTPKTVDEVDVTVTVTKSGENVGSGVFNRDGTLTLTIGTKTYTVTGLTVNGQTQTNVNRTSASDPAGQYDVTITGSITDVTDSSNASVKSLFTLGTVENGSLTITPIDLTITANSADPFTYAAGKDRTVEKDGKEYTVTGDIPTADALDTDSFSVGYYVNDAHVNETNGSCGEANLPTFVGSYVTKIDATDGVKIERTNGGADATLNYNITLLPGTLTITGETLTGTKTAENKTYNLNDVISYTITVTNNGATALMNVKVTDGKAEFQNGSDYTVTSGNVHEATIAALAPGQTVTLTATHTVTAADIAADRPYNNTADITVNGEEVTVTEDVRLDTPDKSYTVTKEAVATNNASGKYKVGDTITYNITVTNTGNVELTDIVLEEKLNGAVFKLNGQQTYTITSLMPNEDETLVVEYTLKQSDVVYTNDGDATLTNTVTAKLPDEPEPNETTETVPVKNAKIDVEKTADTSSGTDQGDTITYTITVQNTGNVPLNTVTVTDAMNSLTIQPFAGVYTVSGSTVTLVNPLAANGETGDSVTITATYTVTAADVSAGSIENTADAKGTDPDGVDVTDTDTETVTPDAPSPNLTLKKTSDVAADDKVFTDDTITYTITATNNGNVDLKDVVLTDALSGLKNGGSDTLTVTLVSATAADGAATPTVNHTAKTVTVGSMPDGSSVTITATYTVTESDILTYTTIDNTISGTAKYDAPNEPNKEYAPTSVTVSDPTKEPNPEITVGKTTTSTGPYELGDRITYNIVVTNAGDVTLHGVKVTEDGGVFTTGTQGSEQTGSDGKVWAIGDMAVGATVELTAEHVVTDADIMNVAAGSTSGHVTNGVTATANQVPNPHGNPIDPKDKDSVTDDTVAPSASLEVTKTASPNTNAAKGQTITYTITVKNTGTLTLTDVNVNDPLSGLAMQNGAGYNVVDNNTVTITSIAPGATVTITAEYVVKDTDVTARKISNTATATADNPNDDPDDPNDNQVTDSATEDVTVADPKMTIDKASAIYRNNARKTGDKANIAEAGDVIKYTITVTNTGNIALTDVKVTEQGTTFTDNAAYTLNEGKTEATLNTSLAAGASAEFYAEYTVTQNDIETKANIANTALGDANYTDAQSKKPVRQVRDDVSDPTDVPNPVLSIVKTTNPENQTYELGDTIEYEIVVTNTGNVTLHDVTVTEDIGTFEDSTNSAYTLDVTQKIATIANLGIGKSVTLYAKHTVTQDDLLAQKNANGNNVINTARVTADPVDNPHSTDPNNPTVTPDPKSDTAEDETVDPNPSLVLDKTATNYAQVGAYQLGDWVEYEITATNDGNLDLTKIILTDELPNVELLKVTEKPDGTAAALDKPAKGQVTITNLPVGEHVTFTARYQVTDVDLAAGNVVNKVSGEAYSPKDPTTPIVPTPAQKTVNTVVQAPSIAVDKFEATSGSMGGIYKAGDVIRYTVRVVNNGNTTLEDVSVTETRPGATFVPDMYGGQLYTLSPDGKTAYIVPDMPPVANEYVELSVVYTVTEADVIDGNNGNLGRLHNLVNGEGYYRDANNTPQKVTDPGDVMVSIEYPNPRLTVEKTATSEPANGVSYALGELIHYSIVVRNDGNLRILNIDVHDTLTNQNWTIAELKPGESRTFYTDYLVTESDIPEISIVNTATAKGKTPGTPNTPATDIVGKDDETVPPDPVDRTLIVRKVSNKTAPVTAGDVITYTIYVTNAGNVTYTNVKVDDDKTNLHETIPTLNVGETRTFTTQYTVTSADVLAGSVYNAVTAEGDGIDDKKDPDPPIPPEGGGDVTDETETPNPHATLLKKSVSQPKNNVAYQAGETIRYAIKVTNDGNVTLENVIVTDPLTKDTWTVATLAPNDSEIFYTSHVVTAAEAAAGKVRNDVTGTFTDPTVPDDPTDPDKPKPTKEIEPGFTEDPTQTNDPSLIVRKKTTSTPANGVSYVLGETINYTITVTNNGGVTLENVTVTDALTNLTKNVGTLEPGKSASVDTSYKVTEADIKAGFVKNVATGSATDPTDPDKPVPVIPGDAIDPTDPAEPHVTITKTTTSKPVNGKTYGVGETITYKVTVTNDGNLTVNNLKVTDPLTGDTWNVSTLKPGESLTFASKAYTVTEADVVRGYVHNEATGTGETDPGEPVPVTPGDTTDPIDPIDPRLKVTKTTTSTPANGVAYRQGEEITYEITVENTGNVTITNVKVRDPLTNGVWPELNVNLTLKPGETSGAFKTRYVVTAADELRGYVTNAATATGSSPDPDKEPHVTPDEVTDPTDKPGARLMVTKVSDKKVYNPGEEIVYTITVKNTGDTVVENITIIDEKLGYTADAPFIPPVRTLNPGQSLTVQLPTGYTVTQDDLLTGRVINAATATGTDPNDPGKPVPVIPGETEDEVAPLNPHATITKTVTSTPANGSVYAPGETIEYKISITNDGNIDLTNVVVNDELTDKTWTVGDLAVGETKVVGTTSYTVTEDDLIAGRVLNVATGTGDSDGGKPTIVPGEVPADPEEPNPSAKIIKVTTSTPSTAGSTLYKAGDVISYDITITNTGNVTLYDVVVRDPLPGVTVDASKPVISANDPEIVVTQDGTNVNITKLPVGASVTFTASYTVTQDDLYRGHVLNEATGTATSKVPDKEPTIIPGEDDEPTETDKPSLYVTKTTTSAPADSKAYKLGEKITYEITVTNNGNVDISAVTIIDELAGYTAKNPLIGIDDAVIDGILKPGATSTVKKVSYIVTEEDIRAGKVINVATADGTAPDGSKPTVTPDDTDDPTEPENPHATIVKTTTSTPADGRTYYELGEEITYEITITNDGNQTLTDVVVSDLMTGDVTADISNLVIAEDPNYDVDTSDIVVTQTGVDVNINKLPVGVSVTFAASHVVTQDDIVAGNVHNEAVGKGDAPGQPPEFVPDKEDNDPEDPNPHATITKTATSKPANGKTYALGETVTYEITITNDGNLDLENVVVTDDLTGQSWTIAKLAVGANATFTTSYVITEADIIRGTVVNVATGDGDSPDGSDPEIIPDDETVTPDDPNPSFTLEKTVVNVPERGYFYEGETARYIVTVVNDGNLTLSEMTLTEQLEGAKFEPGAGYTVSADGKTAIIDTMKPGERIDVAAAYTVKFEDNLTGLTNIVTGKAKGPGGDPSDPENPNGPTDNPKLDPPEKTADEPTPTDEMIDVTGGKTWLDHDNAYGTRPESITVRLMANGEQKDEMTVSEATGWRYSFTGLHKHDKAGNAIAYTVVEDAVTGYDTTYPAEGGVVNALKKFKVTVNHWYEKVGGELVTDPIVAEYEYGQPYDISCIRVPGHKPDKQRVSGTVTGDVTIDLVYIAIPYKLTIYYIYYEDGSTAAPTHEEILYYGDEFRVQSPDISGYLATEATVFGTMGEHDLVYTIIYVPWRNKRGSSSGTGASAPAAPATPVNLTHIDLNVGDCFE